MYDTLSSDYDRFVNWQNRLAVELPFILKHLQANNVRSVLDVATGTGMHAIALAQLGYHAAGADISKGMIERAHQNASSAEIEIQFKVAGFGSIAQNFGEGAFDAILCLGNSLPHLLSAAELDNALLDFVACLRPAGIVIIQNRNFDAVMALHDRWMQPQAYSDTQAEWIFQRFYDFDPDGLLTFNMVTLKRVAHEDWSQNVISSRLRPILEADLTSAVSHAGFSDITLFGNMAGEVFDSETSPNLIVLARMSS